MQCNSFSDCGGRLLFRPELAHPLLDPVDAPGSDVEAALAKRLEDRLMPAGEATTRLTAWAGRREPRPSGSDYWRGSHRPLDAGGPDHLQLAAQREGPREADRPRAYAGPTGLPGLCGGVLDKAAGGHFSSCSLARSAAECYFL